MRFLSPKDQTNSFTWLTFIRDFRTACRTLKPLECETVQWTTGNVLLTGLLKSALVWSINGSQVSNENKNLHQICAWPWLELRDTITFLREIIPLWQGTTHEIEACLFSASKSEERKFVSISTHCFRNYGFIPGTFLRIARIILFNIILRFGSIFGNAMRHCGIHTETCWDINDTTHQVTIEQCTCRGGTVMSVMNYQQSQMRLPGSFKARKVKEEWFIFSDQPVVTAFLVNRLEFRFFFWQTLLSYK